MGTGFDNRHVKERCPAVLPMLGIVRANGFRPVAFGLQRGGFNTAPTFLRDVFCAVAYHPIDVVPHHNDSIVRVW